MTKINTKPIKLLWTGGWDSTYRLCEILTIINQPVQPYYLIDENRISTREELKAQSDIKKILIQKFPHTKKLLLPTKFYCVSDIEYNAAIRDHYIDVKNKIGMGSQYEWLACFCHQNKISNLELGFEKTIGSKKHAFLKNYLVKRSGLTYDSYMLDPRYNGEPFFELLKFYDWPIWLKTRNDMVQVARKYNFYDILHLSWFCHTPRNGKPCGRCNPCKDIIWFGFNYRLPVSAKIRYYTRHLSKQTLKKIIANHA